MLGRLLALGPIEAQGLPHHLRHHVVHGQEGAAPGPLGRARRLHRLARLSRPAAIAAEAQGRALGVEHGRHPLRPEAEIRHERPLRAPPDARPVEARRVGERAQIAVERRRQVGLAERHAIAEEQVGHPPREGAVDVAVAHLAQLRDPLEAPGVGAPLEPDLRLGEEVREGEHGHEREGVEGIGGVGVPLAEEEGAERGRVLTVPGAERCHPPDPGLLALERAAGEKPRRG